MDKLTIVDIGDIVYFWEEKGDLERLSSFEKLKPMIKKEFPDVLVAWENLKAAERQMDRVIKELGETEKIRGGKD